MSPLTSFGPLREARPGRPAEAVSLIRSIAVLIRRCVACVLATLALGGATAAEPPAEPLIEAGAQFESVTLGDTTYRDVQIRSVTARTVMFTHAGGMASLKLRDLPKEWQIRFGFDAAAEAAADEAIDAAAKARPRPTTGKTTSRKRTSPQLEQLLRQFGTAAAIRPEVDLRPKFFAMELIVKNQGRRPSCAIFAIVSALEFQMAEMTGQPLKLSEEYLSWATRKVVNRVVQWLETDEAGNTLLMEGDLDIGFTLNEVVLALRTYGIPLQSSMPNRFGRTLAGIEDPAPAIIEEARSHQRVSIVPIPGRDVGTALNNIVHVLNAGVPVPIGMDWPQYRVIRGGVINAQEPMPGSGHAVTLVGYRSPNGRLEDAYFVFKNSWGPHWGQGGYGLVSYTYLQKSLHSAVLLELQRGS